MHYNNGKKPRTTIVFLTVLHQEPIFFFFGSPQGKVEFDTKVIQNFDKSLCMRQFIQNANIFKAFLSQLSFPSATFGVVNWEG